MVPVLLAPHHEQRQHLELLQRPGLPTVNAKVKGTCTSGVASKLCDSR